MIRNIGPTMERISLADVEEMRRQGYKQSIVAEAEEWLRLGDRADTLAQQVSATFAGVTLGNGIGLRESIGIDHYAEAEELRQLRETDEKLDWKRIDPELLNACNAAPSFLDAEGMRFHAPAFIIAELQGQFHTGFIDRLIYNSILAPEFISLLTAEQRHVIMACISFHGAIEHYDYDLTDIANALMRYGIPGRSSPEAVDQPPPDKK